MANPLEYLAEAAMITWLQNSATHSQTLIANIQHFASDDEMDLPAILVQCQSQQEYPNASGCWKSLMQVSLLTQSDDEKSFNHEAEWERICNCLDWDVLAARLSDYSNFHCYGVTHGESRKDIVDSHWLYTRTINLWIMRKDNS